MKISIALTALVLAIAASLGWSDYRHLQSAREVETKLTAEAASLGISILSPDSADPARVTKRERENREVNAKRLAADYIAYAKEAEALEKTGGDASEAMQKRAMEFEIRMMSLDPAQMRIVVAEFFATRELSEETRRSSIGASIFKLTTAHPQAALALFGDYSDFLKDGDRSEAIIANSLSRWSMENPVAAVMWLRENGGKYAEFITDDTRHRLISGTATQDPKLAFKLIGELGLENSRADYVISDILRTGKTQEERSSGMDALREHLAAMPEGKARIDTANNALTNFAIGVVRDGFEAGSKSIAAYQFTPAELGSFARGLRFSTMDDYAGQWIEWIGAKLPADKMSDRVGSIVNHWVEEDFQAAGKWLSTTPDGPVKNTAIRSYAERVSSYEPETAAQWAETLPPGKDREETFQRIYQNWPKNDDATKATAEAFKTAHGLK
jgi:hypothetical protein